MSADSGSALPARTTRYRRRGRHSSPHQLSLPSDSPALVIAVPGSARLESEDTAVGIADQAAASCQGAEVRIGFLRGGQDSLEEALGDLPSRNGLPAGVVVPLLPFPYPEVDRAIAAAVAAAEAPFVIADHLGPHPLLAEALHGRLADVGLARAAGNGWYGRAAPSLSQHSYQRIVTKQAASVRTIRVTVVNHARHDHWWPLVQPATGLGILPWSCDPDQNSRSESSSAPRMVS